MKNQLIIILCVIALGALALLSLSCGSQPNTNGPNTSGANNSGSNNSGSNNTQTVLPPPPDPCTASDKRKSVEDDIKAQIHNDDSLSDQHDIGHFKYKVIEKNGKLEVFFNGKITGEGKPGNNDFKMEKFFNTFKKVLKKGCVERVVFGPFEDNADSKTIDFTRFEWTASCEAPLVECNGECVRTCNPVGSPMPTPTGNANTGNNNSNTNNSNTNNSNTNTNSNTGANRPN